MSSARPSVADKSTCEAGFESGPILVGGDKALEVRQVFVKETVAIAPKKVCYLDLPFRACFSADVHSVYNTFLWKCVRG